MMKFAHSQPSKWVMYTYMYLKRWCMD